MGDIKDNDILERDIFTKFIINYKKKELKTLTSKYIRS